MATAEERALMGMLPYTVLTIIVTLMAVGKNVTLRLMGSLTYYLTVSYTHLTLPTTLQV